MDRDDLNPGREHDAEQATLEDIIAAEEAFLAQKFGTPYREWTERTPVFLPDFSLWRPASLPFSLPPCLPACLLACSHAGLDVRGVL